MRRVTVAAVLAFAIAPLPGIAGAAESDRDRPPPVPSGEIHGDTPAVVVALDGAGTEIVQRTYRPSGTGPTWRCHYFAAIAAPGTFLGFNVDRSAPITPADGQLTSLECTGDDHSTYNAIFLFDWDLPFGPALASHEAALLARQLLPLPDPDIVTSPPATAAQLVGVATWLAVGDTWQTSSASATLAGVSATVTATPTEVRWDPGDGSAPVICTGPGDRFDPAHPDATSDCAHTYLRSTPTGTTVALTATVTYDVAWTATDGTGGTLDPVTRASTVPLTIREAQARIR